jgi:hypothetical protein
MKQIIPLYRYLPAFAAIKTIESRYFRVNRIVKAMESLKHYEIGG